MGQAALSPITVTAPCASVTAVAYLLLDEVHWLGKGGQPSFCSRSTKCSWSVQLGNIFLTPPQKKPPKTQVPCDGWATGGRGRKKSKKKKKKQKKRTVCVAGLGAGSISEAVRSEPLPWFLSPTAAQRSASCALLVLLWASGRKALWRWWARGSGALGGEWWLLDSAEFILMHESSI